MAKQSNNLPEPDYEYYRNTGDKLDYNMYAKANYQFHPNLNGYLDMQYRGIHYTIEGSDDKADDHVNVDKHWNFFNPKAGINFQKDGHNAFVSFSVANREPNRDNFTEPAGTNARSTRRSTTMKRVTVSETPVSMSAPIFTSWITATS